MIRVIKKIRRSGFTGEITYKEAFPSDNEFRSYEAALNKGRQQTQAGSSS